MVMPGISQRSSGSSPETSGKRSTVRVSGVGTPRDQWVQRLEPSDGQVNHPWYPTSTLLRRVEGSGLSAASRIVLRRKRITATRTESWYQRPCGKVLAMKEPRRRNMLRRYIAGAGMAAMLWMVAPAVQAQPGPPPPPPDHARIDQGTILTVRTNEPISEARADGRIFTGTVDQDVLGSHGQVAIPRGSD